MVASRFLIERAQEYEQRAAHHTERAELDGKDKLEQVISARSFTVIAIVLREIAHAFEHDEERAA